MVARAPSIPALVVVTGVGPFATDTYLAGLPRMQQALQTSAGVVQLTLTAFIVGLAAGQLLIGPASDGYGRRRLLLATTAAFAVTSFLCAAAPSGAVLVLLRLVEGIAAGGGVAIGRAVVGDHWAGPAATTRYAMLAAVTFLGPVLAPALGGVLLTVGTWQLVFVVLGGLGVVMVAAVVAAVPETLPPARRQGSRRGDTWHRMSDLLHERRFMGHVMVQCLATAGFFTYIGGSSFVLQTAYAVGRSGYTLIFATNAVAMALAGLVVRLVVGRTGPAPLRAVGIALSTASSIGLVVLAAADPLAHLPVVVAWILLGVVVAGMGLTIPASTALAQEAGRRSGGTASALQGGLVFLVGAAVTPLTGLIGYTRLLPMAVCMATFFVAASAYLIRSGGTVRRSGVHVAAARPTVEHDPSPSTKGNGHEQRRNGRAGPPQH